MPPDHVHRASLAEVIERDFDRGIPAAKGQESDHTIDKLGVCRIEQPIESFAVPSHSKVEVRTEGRTDRLDVRERGAPQFAALDPRALGWRDPCLRRDVDLAQTTADPEGAQGSADAEGIHGEDRDVEDSPAGWLAIIARLGSDQAPGRTARASRRSVPRLRCS